MGYRTTSVGLKRIANPFDRAGNGFAEWVAGSKKTGDAFQGTVCGVKKPKNGTRKPVDATPGPDFATVNPDNATPNPDNATRRRDNATAGPVTGFSHPIHAFPKPHDPSPGPVKAFPGLVPALQFSAGEGLSPSYPSGIWIPTVRPVGLDMIPGIPIETLYRIYEKIRGSILIEPLGE